MHFGVPLFLETPISFCTICQTESLKIGLLKGTGSSSEHPFFRGKLAVSFGRVVPGGSLPAVSTGAHKSTYRGEITPVTHIVSAMYRGYFTPFITTSWWLNQPI